MARKSFDSEDTANGYETPRPKSRSKSKSAESAKKQPVEYVNGKGWVDEDGNVVEAETGKVKNRRVLELVDNTMEEHEAREQEQARAARNADESSGGDDFAHTATRLAASALKKMRRNSAEVEQAEQETEKKGKVRAAWSLHRERKADET